MHPACINSLHCWKCNSVEDHLSTTAYLSSVADHVRPFMTTHFLMAASSRITPQATKLKAPQTAFLNISVSSLYWCTWWKHFTTEYTLTLILASVSHFSSGLYFAFPSLLYTNLHFLFCEFLCRHCLNWKVHIVQPLFLNVLYKKVTWLDISFTR